MKKELYRRPYARVKRVLDLLLVLILLPLAALLIGVCALILWLETGESPFFVQERPGYKGEIFRMYKLRTMCTETERDGRLLSDMERMSKAGRRRMDNHNCMK